jgi:hypothetical protein
MEGQDLHPPDHHEAYQEYSGVLEIPRNPQARELWRAAPPLERVAVAAPPRGWVIAPHLGHVVVPHDGWVVGPPHGRVVAPPPWMVSCSTS